MIKNVRHRGLKRLIERNDKSGLNAEHLPKIMRVMDHLEEAIRPQDLNIPGYHLHALRGELKGFWSVRITGNFRLIFRMEGGDVFDLDLIDYH